MLRREFCFYLTALLVPDDAPPAPTADRLYADACHDLKLGKRYERIAGWLRQAQNLSPTDYRISLALACALCGRYASLNYAAAFTLLLTTAKQRFPRELAEWEAAQKDPDSEEHGDPKPEPPPHRVFLCKDDNMRPILETPEDRKRHDARVESLRKEARAAWERAGKQAGTDREKAEVAFYRGWCLRLLMEYPAEYSYPAANEGEEPEYSRFREPQNEDSEAAEAAETPEPEKPEHVEMVAAFREAVRLAPENATYWQSLGEVLGGKEADAAFQKSLALAPRNPALWFGRYRSNLLTMRNDSGRITPEGRAFLRQAKRFDPDNGIHSLLEAHHLLAETDFERYHNESRMPPGGETAPRKPYRLNADALRTAEQAMALVREGTAKPIRPLRAASSVPRLLAVPWNYAFRDTEAFPEMARFRSLARAISGIALFHSQQGNLEAAEKDCALIVGLGATVAGEWTVRENPRVTPTVLYNLVGIAISAIGYRLTEEIARASGDPVKYRQATDAQQAFRERSAAFRGALQANLNSVTEFDYY
ncbi:MAG: hypothetical protein SFU56_12425 [Capsulimonadales bacterium]|nr:hypothetical protein [Capsulimonadales bacterium]